jgi:hypothetical protein
MIRGLGAGLLALACVCAPAHDLITAQSAERYLAESARLQALLAAGPALQRATASYALGVMLDEIRELLNRDLAAHGEVQGLPSNYLIAELRKRGTPLTYSASQRRYLANTVYFSRSLRLAARSDVAADAGFRLLQGTFYDSFGSDPLRSVETRETLMEQIALGESLASQPLTEEQREESQFILAVRYVRAALTAEGAGARTYREKARTALTVFESDYPESLRAAAIPVLREALEGR